MIRLSHPKKILRYEYLSVFLWIDDDGHSPNCLTFYTEKRNGQFDINSGKFHANYIETKTDSYLSSIANIRQFAPNLPHVNKLPTSICPYFKLHESAKSHIKPTIRFFCVYLQ